MHCSSQGSIPALVRTGEEQELNHFGTMPIQALPALNSGRKGLATMRHRSIKALYTYWESLRAGRPAPERSELDPAAIASVLGDLFLLDGDIENFAFRLAGSRIAHALGYDLTGLSFLTAFTDKAVKDASHALEAVAETINPSLIGIRIEGDHHPDDGQQQSQALPFFLRSPQTRGWTPGPFADRRTMVGQHGEMLLLPLSHQGRQGGRILGALAFFQPPLDRRSSPAHLDVIATRILGQDSRPRDGLGLVPEQLAAAIVARRGHLVLMNGARKD